MAVVPPSRGENRVIRIIVAIILVATSFAVGVCVGGIIVAGFARQEARRVSETNAQEIGRLTGEANKLREEISNIQQEVSRAKAGHEEQYYRGLFDMCVFFEGNMYFVPAKEAQSDCLKFSANTSQAGWYAQGSDGWKWLVGENQ